MTTSLYDLSVPTYLQTLRAVGGFLDKSLTYLHEAGIDPEEVVATRLHPDMLPFRFQVQSVVHHSKGAMEAVRSGEFGPPSGLAELDYAGLQAGVEEAIHALGALTPDAVNAHEDKEVVFVMRDMRMPYTAVNFVLSFSIPNFQFHAATAYGILRAKGAPLGKRDYIGRPRMKM